MNKRTTVSTWIYWLTFIVLVLATIILGIIIWYQLQYVRDRAFGPALWVATFSNMSITISCGVAAVAMILRSGAVIWLLGLQFLFIAVPVFLGGHGDLQKQSLILLLLIALLSTGTVLFTYLVRKEELRAP